MKKWLTHPPQALFPESCCTNGTLRHCQQLYSSRPASGPVTVLLPVVPCGQARKTHQRTPLSQRWASWRRVAARWVKKEARHRAQPELACPQQTMDGTSNSFSSCNAGAGFAIPRRVGTEHRTACPALPAHSARKSERRCKLGADGGRRPHGPVHPRLELQAMAIAPSTIAPSASRPKPSSSDTTLTQHRVAVDY
jgi:hypothetical protein